MASSTRFNDAESREPKGGKIAEDFGTVVT
jgi:hypothetical protein